MRTWSNASTARTPACEPRSRSGLRATPGGRVRRGRAGAGLGERERDDRLPRARRREPPALDLLGAVLAEDLAGQARELDAVGAAEVAARNLLGRDPHRDEG